MEMEQKNGPPFRHKSGCILRYRLNAQVSIRRWAMPKTAFGLEMSQQWNHLYKRHMQDWNVLKCWITQTVQNDLG